MFHFVLCLFYDFISNEAPSSYVHVRQIADSAITDFRCKGNFQLCIFEAIDMEYGIKMSITKNRSSGCLLQ